MSRTTTTAMSEAQREELATRIAAVITATAGLYLAEANAGPGTEQKIARAIVDMLFPAAN